MRKTVKLVALLSAVGIVSATCTGAPKCKIPATADAPFYAQARTTMGDSLLNIFLSADKAIITKRQLVDGKVTDITGDLDKAALPTLKFLVTSPKNYVTDYAVYGYFTPTVFVKLAKGKKQMTLAFDLNLEKWGVKDANDSLLFRRDIATAEIARFINAVDGDITVNKPATAPEAPVVTPVTVRPLPPADTTVVAAEAVEYNPAAPADSTAVESEPIEVKINN